MLRLHDTATEQVQELGLSPGRPVGLYVCGPTVYGPPHLGHGRLVLAFDVLRRWLEASGLRVEHVSNVTDVDDKIIDRAERERRSPEDVAAEAEKQWWEAMGRLGCLEPSAIPHATGWVGEMVALVEELLAASKAYRTSEGVYLDVAQVPGYGLLKHQDLGSLRAGARVAVGEEKRSPADFALWKAAKPGEPTWAAPFGAGRPGWHTECVAMSLGLLGEGFDLHGGGNDLIFPHHENERAQAEALGRPFARHWVHSGLVTVEGEKMAKSLGNFTTLADLFERADPRAYRLLALRAHYRSPLEVRPELLEDASRGLGRLDALARRVEEVEAGGQRAAPGPEAAALASGTAESMDDDLDTPRATALLLTALRRANGLLDAGDHPAGLALAHQALEGLAILGLAPATPAGAPDEQARELVRLRDAARAGGDYAASDRLRSQLQELGWRVEDTPSGTRLHR